MFFSVNLKKSGLLAGVLALIVCLITAFNAPVTADEQGGVKVPIIMYHSITPDESRLNDYVLSPVQLEEDLIWLRENGYETVFVSELSDYVRTGAELPERCAVLTFDDGMYNNLTYVLPLLEKYDMKATVSIVGSFSEYACEEAEPSDNCSYLDYSDIRKLYDSGRVEIANHTYAMHSTEDRQGCMIMESESFEDYRRAFFNDIFKNQNLINDNCGVKPKIFTYPYGFTCDAAKSLVRECGFVASLGTASGVNTLIRGDTDCLYGLARTNRPSFVSSEDFMTGMGLESL